MLVYQGRLYAAITDAGNEKDWCHVFRYEGKQKWTDCGRVGTNRTTGVGPLVVHDGGLYAVTWTYDWTRVKSGHYDAGRVYRYAGGTRTVDIHVRLLRAKLGPRSAMIETVRHVGYKLRAPGAGTPG